MVIVKCASELHTQLRQSKQVEARLDQLSLIIQVFVMVLTSGLANGINFLTTSMAEGRIVEEVQTRKFTRYRHKVNRKNHARTVK